MVTSGGVPAGHSHNSVDGATGSHEHHHPHDPAEGADERGSVGSGRSSDRGSDVLAAVSQQ